MELNAEQVTDIEPQVQEAPDSVRADIENAIKEVGEKALTPELQEDKAAKPARARDETGKFAKAEAKELAQEKAEIAAVAPAEEVKEIKESAAPVSWGAADKEVWAKLPEEARIIISRREDEAHRVLTRHDEERNFGKSLREVMNPYMPTIQAEGGNPVVAVRDLLHTAYQLRTGTPQQRGQLIMQIAQQYGAELPTNSPMPQSPPQFDQLGNRIGQLEGTVQQWMDTIKQQEQETIQSTIATFAANPKNVHFEEVKADMAALLNGGRAKDLEEAYDKAVWARPDIRSTLLEAEFADKEAKRIAETKAKAEAARRASGSIVGSPGAAISNKGAPERDLREEIAANVKAAFANR